MSAPEILYRPLPVARAYTGPYLGVIDKPEGDTVDTVLLKLLRMAAEGN